MLCSDIIGVSQPEILLLPAFKLQGLPLAAFKSTLVASPSSFKLAQLATPSLDSRPQIWSTFHRVPSARPLSWPLSAHSRLAKVHVSTLSTLCATALPSRPLFIHLHPCLAPRLSVANATNQPSINLDVAIQTFKTYKYLPTGSLGASSVSRSHPAMDIIRILLLVSETSIDTSV